MSAATACPPTPRDEELLGRFAAGESAALEELFRRYRVRYVVLDYLFDWEWRRPGLKPIWFGSDKVIYVAPDDPLPAHPDAAVPSAGVTELKPGLLEIRAPDAAGCRYAIRRIVPPSRSA